MRISLDDRSFLVGFEPTAVSRASDAITAIPSPQALHIEGFRMTRHSIRRGMIRKSLSGIESLEPRRLLAAVSWDGGAGTAFWTDANNWSTDALPGIDDDVTIDVPAAITVTLSSGTQAIKSLTSAENLTVSGTGTLSVAAASTINGAFTLAGTGQVTGDGDLTLNGTGSIAGGTLSGAGLLHIGAAATVSVTGGAPTLSKNVDNDGTFNMSSTGDLNFAGATFTNDNALNISGGSPDFGNTSGVNAFINNGTVTKSAVNAGFIRVPTTNNGTININAGTLTFTTTSGTSITNNAQIAVATGAILSLGSLVANAGSMINGDGTVAFITGGTSTLESGRFATTGNLTFAGGTVTVNVPRVQSVATTLSGNVTFNQPVTFNLAVTVPGTANFTNTASFATTLGISGTATFSSTGTFGGVVTVTNRLNVDTAAPGLSIPNLAVSGGTLGGSGLLIVTGTLSSNGNMTMDGSGTTRLATGATLPNVGNAWGINLGHTFHNQGTVTMGGDNPDIYLSDGTFINDGVLQSVNGTSLDTITNDPGTNLFINNGTIRKTVGGASSVLSIEVPIQHNGLIDVGPGSINLSGSGSTYAAASSTTGTGNINFNGGSHTFLGATTLDGISVAGLPFFTGGTLTFNVDTTVSNGRFGGSTVEGAGTLSLGNGTQVYGGYFSPAGNGRLRVPVGATAQFNGNNPVVGRPFDILGTVQMPSGGDMNVLNTIVTIEVGGTLHFNAAAGGSDIEYASGATSGMVVNKGTVRREVGGSASIEVRFDNQGLVQGTGGTLSINGGFADGTYTRTTGKYDVGASTLNFGGAVNTNGAEIIARLGASIGGMTNLQYNDGKFDLRDGIDWAFDPFASQGNTMYQRGQIELSPGSVFSLAPGNNLVFAGSGNATVRSEIAGPTDAEYGRLVVGGQLRLASADGGNSQLDPELIGGYDPALGTRFNIVTAGSVIDAFDDFFGATTPSGLHLLAGRSATQFYAEVGAATLPPAPQILSAVFEFETREAIVLTLNTDVSAFVSRKDLAIVNVATGQTVSTDIGQLAYDAGSNTVTLTFTKLLPDARYELKITADDIANAAGATLTTPLSLPFHILTGDANRDRVVNFADLVILAQNYGQTGKTYSKGNFNYSSDTKVDFADLVILAQRYNATVLAAGLTTTPTVASKEEKPQRSLI